MERPIMLVDALNLFMRHFVVNPSMSLNGNHVGGVVGFLKSLQILVDENMPERLYVIWEGGGSARRRAIFPDYKNGRRPAKLNRYYEDDIPTTVGNRNEQVNCIVNLLKFTGVKQIYVENCEADDAIGYIAKNQFHDRKIVIVSSDKDYYQLLKDERITVWSPGQKSYITPAGLRERFGCGPENFCTVRCFVGDGSDGLPGVKGAGFPTMIKRFPELTGEDHVSVDDIVTKCMATSGSSKVQLFKNIVEEGDIAKRNWQLMYLDIANLSAEHIKKLTYSIDTPAATPNKMNFIRCLNQNGIQGFDVNKFFMSISLLNR